MIFEWKTNYFASKTERNLIVSIFIDQPVIVDFCEFYLDTFSPKSIQKALSQQSLPGRQASTRRFYAWLAAATTPAP
jgi:hypothetical protein